MTHLLRKDATLCERDGAAVTTVASFLALAAPCRPCLDLALHDGIVTIRQWSDHASNDDRVRRYA